MADKENIEPEDIDDDELEDTPNQPIQYEDLVTEEPELEVDFDEYDVPKTVTETEEDSPQTSDIKAILKSLTPKSKYPRVNDFTQPAMVSRIFPDNFLDKMKISTFALMEEYGDGVDIPIVDIIMGIQDGLSIGYEGKGIVDRMELAGVARDEEIEKLARDLNI